MRVIASFSVTHILTHKASAERSLTDLIKKTSEAIEPLSVTAIVIFLVSLLVNVVVKLNECAAIIQYCGGPSGF
jgi:cell division protein FtsX